MTLEVAPKAAESARPRIEGGKGDRLKPAGGQGLGAGAGDFAGLLSLSVAEEAPDEPTTDAAANTMLTVQPGDKPPMDLAAMLALLAGIGDGHATDAAVLSEADTAKPQPPGPRSRDGAKGAVRTATLAGVKPAAGRADALAPEHMANGKAGAVLPVATSSITDGPEVAPGLAGTHGNQTVMALAALLAGGKGDGHGGGHPTGGGGEHVPPSLMSSGGGLEAAGRPQGSGPDKAAEVIGKPALEGLNPAASQAAEPGGSLPAVSETPALQISDAMLADTVSYWVAQGVQSAELTLDGFGGEPIEVSIQLANGEAQIGFRSDLPETRQVIEGAMAQLKDSLASQGVVLAGVSVGTSSRQDGNPGEGQRRPGGRLRGISLADSVTARPEPRPNRSTGQRLDLFV